MRIQELFYDSDLAREFSEKGFVVIELLSKANLEALEAAHNQITSDSVSGHGFYASIWSNDKTYRERVNDEVNKVLFSLVKNKIKDVVPVLGSFHVKQPGTGELGAHQDWSFVDEPENDSCLVWCPLDNVDEHNGCLHVIPFSHNLQNYIRGRFFDVPFLQLPQTTVAKMLQPVPLRAGEAIIMHSRLVHASMVNKSNRARVAASIVIKPENSLLFHWVMVNNSNGAIQRKVAVTADFFSCYNCFESLEHLSSIESQPYGVTQMTEEKLMAICRYPQDSISSKLTTTSIVKAWLSRYFKKAS